MSAEVEWAEVPYPVLGQGQAGPSEPPVDDDHGPHAFLYVPDYAAETGWSTHRVPERQPERVRSRLGFKR